ncbi:hypothetical protein NEOC65_000802 [Neochlamydia sp. AcF65]|nr:hypothetical protein [Neochlamydia sp. AcF65]
MVFHHSVEELKQGAKKSRFSQIRQRINLILFRHTKIAASLNPQDLWLLLNAWKAPAFSLNLSEIKAWWIIFELFFLDKDTNCFDLPF